MQHHQQRSWVGVRVRVRDNTNTVLGVLRKVAVKPRGAAEAVEEADAFETALDKSMKPQPLPQKPKDVSTPMDAFEAAFDMLPGNGDAGLRLSLRMLAVMVAVMLAVMLAVMMAVVMAVMLAVMASRHRTTELRRFPTTQVCLLRRPNIIQGQAIGFVGEVFILAL